MKNLLSHWWTRLVLGAALAAVPARSASAGDFHINPVRLDLNQKTRTALLSINNPGPEELRLQVSLYSWTQDEKGKIALAPTRELTYFPSLLTVEPGTSRNIRVGGLLPAAAAERTFRLIVEQLPPSTAPAGGGTQIRVLTRMSIPLFVASSEPSLKNQVEDLGLTGGTVSFSLRNLGNTHVFAKKARVQGRDADGQTVLDQEQTGWYVLAGDKRQFSLPLPPELCRRLRTLSVEVATDKGTFPSSTAVMGDRCGS